MKERRFMMSLREVDHASNSNDYVKDQVFTSKLSEKETEPLHEYYYIEPNPVKYKN